MHCAVYAPFYVTLQIYTVETGTPLKPVLTFYHFTSAAIKCKQYNEITVESGTPVKSLKIKLNISAV